MIAGIGIDLIEVERVGARIASGNGFREYVFSAYEIEYCESMRHKDQHYAARFCAKEAFLKAMGTGLTGEIVLSEIEVRQERNKRPEIKLYGAALDIFNQRMPGRILLSMSHLKDTATAMVIIEQ